MKTITRQLTAPVSFNGECMKQPGRFPASPGFGKKMVSWKGCSTAGRIPKAKIKTLAVFLLLFFPLPGALHGPLYAQDAASILDKMDEVLFAPEDQKSSVRMILTDRQGNERIRQASVWQKGSGMRLFRFTAPAAEAGIAFLSLPGEVMYLYMPAYGRERRIASHVKNQAFAGTDFSYEDLEAERYGKRFSPELKEETDSSWVIILTPLPHVRSDYSKIIAHIDKQHHFPLVMESFDCGGQAYKVAEYQFERQGSLWFTREILMTNKRRNHNTRMIFEEVLLNSGIGEEVFTLRNLSRH